MKMQRFIISLLLGITAFADGEEYFFRQYNNDQGLKHTFIYSIVQDSSGYLWIGSGEGLYRFDGIEFDYYTMQDGLADNFAAKVFTDSSGKLWVGHGNGSVTVHDGNEFNVVYKGSDSSGSLTSFSQDAKGRIWATIQNGGIITFTGLEVDTSVRFSLTNEPLSQIATLGNNHFLLGSQEHLYLAEFKPARGEMSVLETLEGYEGSKVIAIIPGDHGSHYVISQDYGFYDFRFDPSSSEYSLESMDLNSDGSLDNIQGGLWDDQASLWLVSMGNGLLKYKFGDLGEIISREVITREQGLVSNLVRCVYKDSEGNLWLGMYGEGLLKYAENTLSFLSIWPQTRYESGASPVSRG